MAGAEQRELGELVEFGGFFKESVTFGPGERILFDFSFMTKGLLGCFAYFCCPPCSSGCRKTLENIRKQQPRTAVRVLDARKKEDEEGLSKREFFEKHGFVLLPHKTQMAAEDWLANTIGPAPNQAALDKQRAEAQEKSKSSPITGVYAKEVEPLLRELIPNAADVECPPFALRRGPGGPNNFYGLGVHQDFGLYPEDMKSVWRRTEADPSGHFGNYEGWQAKMEEGGFSGFSTINFWRPVLPMIGPVQNTPLAVCDPNTVKMDEIVPQDLYGFVPGGQHNMGIKFSADQRWYYYPDMTKDEVLVFRQFHYEKGAHAPYSGIKTVFHTAFNHPRAPKDAEVRCSSEYRVNVFLK
mmetsp:Transcript_57930/g.130281  ORF Transcript_57930/g.130281 Transcript_57930/m.130281 type:complete len:354 (-) Transcript_57930:246-1307(-)